MTTPMLSCILSHCCCTVFIFPRSITDLLIARLSSLPRNVTRQPPYIRVAGRPHVRVTRVAGRLSSVKARRTYSGTSASSLRPAGAAQSRHQSDAADIATTRPRPHVTRRSIQCHKELCDFMQTPSTILYFTMNGSRPNTKQKKRKQYKYKRGWKAFENYITI